MNLAARRATSYIIYDTIYRTNVREVNAMAEQNIIGIEQFETRRRQAAREADRTQFERRIPKAYKHDLLNYEAYVQHTHQQISAESMYDYLYHSITEEKVKKSTFEKRLAAIKKLLKIDYNYTFLNDETYIKETTFLRSLFNEEQYARQKQIKGKKAVDSTKLKDALNKLDTRGRAICLVNLITGNRPNEMVALQIKDFDLKSGTVDVYLKKQRQFKTKRLTSEVVQSIQAYIREYSLKPDDYFVGQIIANQYGRKYRSKHVSERTLLNDLTRWTGLSGYNFRKTLVSDMHEKGADLATIAEQTGHRSLQTITNHYLTVSDKTIDKFLP